MQNAFRSFLVLSCLLASCGSGIEPEVASRPALISTETGGQASPNDDDHPTEDHDDATFQAVKASCTASAKFSDDVRKADRLNGWLLSEMCGVEE